MLTNCIKETQHHNGYSKSIANTPLQTSMLRSLFNKKEKAKKKSKKSDQKPPLKSDKEKSSCVSKEAHSTTQKDSSEKNIQEQNERNLPSSTSSDESLTQRHLSSDTPLSQNASSLENEQSASTGSSTILNNNTTNNTVINEAPPPPYQVLEENALPAVDQTSTHMERSSSENTLFDPNGTSLEDLFSMTSKQSTVLPPYHNQSQRDNFRTILRKVPFVTVLLKNGVYCFSSDKSLNVYKENKRKLHLFQVGENEEVLGVPLFHCIALSLIKGLLSKNPMTHKIFKYIAIPCNSHEQPVMPENLLNPEIICLNADKTHALVKFEFCLVNEKNSFFTNSHTQYLDFQLPDRKTGLNYQVSLKSGVFYRYTEVSLSYKPALKLRWLGTSSMASVFGSLSFKLAVFDQFPDEDERRDRENRRARILGTWATFSNSSATIIPRKRTLRCGDLLVGEAVFQEQPVTGSFSQDTEAIICMVFILYDHEIRKERGSSPMITSGAAMGLAVGCA